MYGEVALVDAQQRKAAAALLSVASNTVLITIKAVVGVLIGSVSVISEAIHSGMDLLAAGMALWAVRTSDRPADESHPFGHGKIENISGTVEALLILVAGVWIILEAVDRLQKPHLLDEAGWGVLWRTGGHTRSEPVRRMHGLADNEELLGWLYVGGVIPGKNKPRRPLNPEQYLSTPS